MLLLVDFEDSLPSLELVLDGVPLSILNPFVYVLVIDELGAQLIAIFLAPHLFVLFAQLDQFSEVLRLLDAEEGNVWLSNQGLEVSLVLLPLELLGHSFQQFRIQDKVVDMLPRTEFVVPQLILDARSRYLVDVRDIVFHGPSFGFRLFEV